ncbi:MAG: hypothetical protein ACM37W_22990 [Actinomycetota bacterium]
MRRIDILKRQAADLGISNETAKTFGSLSKTSTWEKVIECHIPSEPQPQKLLSDCKQLQLQPARIICPTCLARHAAICYRCEGTGKIFNLVKIRAGYSGTARLPKGVA